jgi:diphthamide synthase (EF-2-diphthine--ammonia ligase)
MIEPIVLLRSGGKNSTLALHALEQDARYEVRALLTMMTQGFDRVGIDGVRRALLEQQASLLRPPLERVYTSQTCLNANYDRAMTQALVERPAAVVVSVIAGDIILEDV